MMNTNVKIALVIILATLVWLGSGLFANEDTSNLNQPVLSDTKAHVQALDTGANTGNSTIPCGS